MSAVTVNKPGVPKAPEAFPTPMGRGLFRMDPFALLREFMNDVEPFVAKPVSREGPEFWMPVVEVKRTNGTLLVKAELPGLEKQDLKVQVVEHDLILEGERKQEKEEKGDRYYRAERSYGHFFRSIPLPETAAVDKIKAELNNGLLEITIPCEEAKKEVKEVPVGEKAH
ncbi:MAG: Hsp20/alpha crystallin family protein [Bryobacterales bacterium]|nr:Hsp20/alpha crystallin family protein [Bryobacterales bacterium]